jgi:cation/acetate symporter
MILQKGFKVEEGGIDGYKFQTLTVTADDLANEDGVVGSLNNVDVLDVPEGWDKLSSRTFICRIASTKRISIWHVVKPAVDGDPVTLTEAQTVTKLADGKVLINGLPKGTGPDEAVLHPIGYLKSLPDGKTETGPLSPVQFFSTLQQSEVVLWRMKKSN